MNAFDTTGPSKLLTKRELSNAQRPHRHNTPGTKYFDSKPSRFCTQIQSREEQDKTARIAGRQRA